jgi:hypothetical protein
MASTGDSSGCMLPSKVLTSHTYHTHDLAVVNTFEDLTIAVEYFDDPGHGGSHWWVHFVRCSYLECWDVRILAG